MNLIDNRSPHAKFYAQFTNAFDELTEAERKAKEARETMKKLWSEFLDYCNNRGIEPIQAETIFLQDGGWLYKVEVDIEEFSTPSISRVEDNVSVQKIER